MERAARHRRARRSVLLALGIFAVLQAGFLSIVEGWRPTLADTEFGTRLERLRAIRQHHPQRKSVVVLGSSRVGNGFDSDFATACSLVEKRSESPTVVNMSMTGGTSVWQYLALRRLIDHGLKPDAVIVEILPMTLVSDAQYFGRTYHFPAHRLRWGDVRAIGSIMPDEAWRHTSEWIANNAIFPLHTHRFTLVGLFLPKWQVDLSAEQSQPRKWRTIISHTGWIPFGIEHPTREERRKAEEVARTAYSEYGQAASTSAKVEETYRKIFACCREHEIDVMAVVLMPESETFRGLYGPGLQGEVKRFASTITREYGIRVVDAREWIPAEEFWDGHHLLPTGARSFTERICTEMFGFCGSGGTQRMSALPGATAQ